MEIPKSYIAANGLKRKWRYSDNERPGWRHGQPVEAMCYDCRTPYYAMVDVVIPNKLWEKINPTKHKSAGILCSNCIFERLHQIGVYRVQVS
jgi:hypothetical protein